jgi:predicted DNA-binding protein (MmcQ/YjbR family)
MTYDFIQAYCLSKAAAEEEFKADWDAILYKVGGKMFALIGDDASDESVISVKLDPDYACELREHYADITPGYHLNKTHWSSIKLNGSVPAELLKEAIDQSYKLVMGGLSKKKQRELSL